MNIFSIEMFTFAYFAQTVKFERSQFKKVGVTISKSYLFVLVSLRVLGESCFEALNVPLDEYFYH